MFHKLSDIQSKSIGIETTIWQYCVVLPNAIIENDVLIGDNVTIKSGVQIWNGVTLEDNVFIGPNVTLKLLLRKVLQLVLIVL